MLYFISRMSIIYMNLNTKYLYRENIYNTQLHEEHLAFLKKGLHSQLTIPNPKNSMYYPSLLQMRRQKRIISQLKNKENKSKFQYLFLIVALKLTGESFHHELSQFKNAYQNYDHSTNIEKYVGYFSNIPIAANPSQTKEVIRSKFQNLLLKGERQAYFRIPDVPVFLLSTKWLDHLYSISEEHPPPISNQILVESVAFPLAEEKYLHYNYTVRQDLRENQDYRLIPYEAWEYLYSLYGGFEVKRFTTKEKEPIVEVWPIKVSILIGEERCIFHSLELIVSKGETLMQFIQRIALILKRYRIVPEKYFNKGVALFKTGQLSEKRVVEVIHDDKNQLIANSRFHKLPDLTLEIEEAGIMTPLDILIVNFGGEKGIFSKVTPFKVNIRQRCLNCGIRQDIVICKCKTVYFCSDKCKEAQKAHIKDCSLIILEARRYNLVLEQYDVNRRVFPNFNEFEEKGKKGMQNLGNTCYMNSALQCLLRMPEISAYFLANKHIADLNVQNCLGSSGQIACAYGELVKDSYTSNQRVLIPSDILKCIARNPQFRGYNHQDSQQFLNYFLDKLHQDLNKVKVKPYVEDIQSNGRPDQLVSRLSWQNYRKRNDSFLSNILAGQYRSEIRCPDCDRISITFDPFLSATLQFPKPRRGQKTLKQISVEELLDCFSQPERLTQENAWYCNVCKDHKLALKTMSLYSLPQYLILHLKRFNHRGDSGNRFIIYGQKITTQIILREQQDIGGQKYELLGIVNHVGSLLYGHYTACVKRDDWYIYDDSQCGRSSYVNGKNAYLLFYRRVR